MLTLIYLYLEPFKALNEAFWSDMDSATFTCTTTGAYSQSCRQMLETKLLRYVKTQVNGWADFY